MIEAVKRPQGETMTERREFLKQAAALALGCALGTREPNNLRQFYRLQDGQWVKADFSEMKPGDIITYDDDVEGHFKTRRFEFVRVNAGLPRSIEAVWL